MSNFQPSMSLIKMCKTPKQLLRAKLGEAKKLLADAKALAKNATPPQLTALQDNLESLTDSMQEIVDKQIKEETGYSISEIKTKCGEGIRLFKQYKELHRSENEEIVKDNPKRKEKLKKRRAQIKVKLKEWLKKQTEPVYNAFLALQLKETAEEMKTTFSMLQSQGKESFKTIVEDLKNLKEMFPINKKGKVEKDKEEEEVKSDIDITEEVLKEGDLDMKAFIAEMAKSAKSTDGAVDINLGEVDEKTVSSFNVQLMSICDKISTIVPIVYTFIENYKSNKDSLRGDAEKNSNNLLKRNAKEFGLSAVKKCVPSIAKLVKINLPNPYLIDDEKKDEELEGSNTQQEDMEFMKVIFPVKDSSEIEFYDDKSLTEDGAPISFEMHTSSSDEVFVSAESENLMFSELNRIVASIDSASKDCKFDKNANIISHSSTIDGGNLKNLEKIGNTRKDIIDAILLVNGGKRL